jgi:hypothetical protein
MRDQHKRKAPLDLWIFRAKPVQQPAQKQGLLGEIPALRRRALLTLIQRTNQIGMSRRA